MTVLAPIRPGDALQMIHLESVRDGNLALDQWGYRVPVDSSDPAGETRRVTYFEVLRTPGADPIVSAADAILYFTTKHKELPVAPGYLGEVNVTDSYINARFSKE